ncbi:MAG: hypothetical protein HOP28_13465 [Gemmatimonadales bacterium]|nr:hypothetical protein [Gemmatimonadales bacterium]
MRTMSLLTLAALVVSPLAAQGGKPSDPDKNVAGTGTLPAGWSARLDLATASLATLKLVSMPPGWHITTGPSGIFYRAADAATGSFHTIATIHQTKAPAHPEAFGLFVAGKDLDKSTAAYVYLIVRGDGMYTIRQGGAVGARSKNLTTGGDVNGWLPSDAVVKQDGNGQSKNVIEVTGNATTKKLTFTVNGKQIAEIDAPGGNVGGIVGLRVNHHLDVHVQDFAVHKL